MDSGPLLQPFYRRYEAARRGRTGADKDREAARVARAHDGDNSVWDDWFQDCYRPLFRYAYIRLHSKIDAEDIVSQVFVEAYRGIHKYEYTGRPLLAWLYRIAHNLIYDSQKVAARQSELTATDGIALDEGPESLILNFDLLSAIDCLAEEQRDVIILRYFLAMSAQEAADAIGKTPTAVFSLQARALVNLRKNMADGLSP